MSIGERLIGDSVPPLVVDLDGTLIRTDLLVESLFAYLGADPLRFWSLLPALRKGKAPFKAEIARHVAIDPAHLPYDDRVLSLIHDARENGRRVFLASASNERYVRVVAQHLGFFDGWFASTDSENLSSSTKAQRLVEAFEERGLTISGTTGRMSPSGRWPIEASRSPLRLRLGTRLKAADASAHVFESQSGGLRAWMKLLRVHQWVKSSLVFVPIFASHRFDFSSAVEATAAAIAFSLAASSIYILNDLVDLDADRVRSKKRRPLAAGTVSIRQAMIVAPILFVSALAIGLHSVSICPSWRCCLSIWR